MTQTIELTQGQVALVDDLDFDRINQWKWYAVFNSKLKSFYAVRNSGGKTILMHRIIAKTPSGLETDHRNHDTLDNRGENLRICSIGQNQHNQKMARNNTSGYKGVSWSKATRKWQAQIKFNGRRMGLGYYHTPIEAALAYNAKARELFGEFALLNSGIEGK